MKESKFDKILQKRIQQLPEFELKQGIWRNIHSRLGFEKHLEETLKALPLLQPDKESWNSIAKNLENKIGRNRFRNPKSISIYVSAIAASISILVGVYFKTSSRPDITITEEVVQAEQNIDFQWILQDPLVYINEQCEKKNSICETPEFVENKNQLDELNKELENLNVVIDRYGESPELIKSVIKIENLKTEIILKLMHSLNS